MDKHVAAIHNICSDPFPNGSDRFLSLIDRLEKLGGLPAMVDDEPGRVPKHAIDMLLTFVKDGGNPGQGHQHIGLLALAMAHECLEATGDLSDAGSRTLERAAQTIMGIMYPKFPVIAPPPVGDDDDDDDKEMKGLRDRPTNSLDEVMARLSDPETKKRILGP